MPENGKATPDGCQKGSSGAGQPKCRMAKPIKRDRRDLVEKGVFMYRGQNADRNGDHEDQGPVTGH